MHERKTLDLAPSGGIELKRRHALGSLAALLGSIWLGGCGGEQATTATVAGRADDATDSPLKIITSITLLADLVRQVAGEDGEIISLTRPGADVHTYQPTPKDIARTQGADIVFWNGLNLEAWFEKFLQNVDAPAVRLSEGVTPIDMYGDDGSSAPNPHAWMSLSNVRLYLDNIVAALGHLRPAKESRYRQNADAYFASLQQAISPLQRRIEALPEAQRWLVSSEGAFSYLAADTGLKELYLWTSNADAQGTPQQVRKVIDTMRAEQIGVIFSESTVSDKPARQVAAEVGARYGGVLYVDSLSEANGPVPTFRQLLETTLGTIVAGLETAHGK